MTQSVPGPRSSHHWELTLIHAVYQNEGVQPTAYGHIEWVGGERGEVRSIEKFNYMQMCSYIIIYNIGLVCLYSKRVKFLFIDEFWSTVFRTG